MKWEMIPIPRYFSLRGFYTAFPFSWDDAFSFNGESHDFWEAVYLKSGAVEIVEDEKIYKLGDNQLIFHAPGEFHRIRSVPGFSPKGFIMSFEIEGGFPEILRKGVFSLTPEEAGEYREICRDIAPCVEKKTSLSLFQQGADRLSSFLIRLSKKTPDRQLIHSVGAENYRRILSDIIARVEENRTLAQIAADHHISVSYLKLLFREYAGISPKTYYNNLRLQYAATLLQGTMTVAEVAEKMEFSSQNYFTVFFRNGMGCTPSEYRKRRE